MQNNNTVLIIGGGHYSSSIRKLIESMDLDLEIVNVQETQRILEVLNSRTIESDLRSLKMAMCDREEFNDVGCYVPGVSIIFEPFGRVNKASLYPSTNKNYKTRERTVVCKNVKYGRGRKGHLIR